MKRFLTAVTCTMLACLAIVGLDSVAYAATGQSMILGHLNKAKKATGVKNTGKGPALVLTTKKKYPPLRVTSRTKVTRLNADSVDGLDGNALQAATKRKVYVFHGPGAMYEGGTAVFGVSGVPAGTYQVTYAVAMTVLDSTPSPGIVGKCRFQSFRLEKAAQTTAPLVGAEVDLSGAGVITYEGDDTWQLICGATDAGAAEGWAENLDQAAQVTMTRVDTVVSGDLTVAP
jgi:hypothetical protein